MTSLHPHRLQLEIVLVIPYYDLWNVRYCSLLKLHLVRIPLDVTSGIHLVTIVSNYLPSLCQHWTT